MKHLTFEEMTGFILFQSLDKNTVHLLQRVNGHICKCAECRKKLRAFQDVDDGFLRMIRKSGPAVCPCGCENVKKISTDFGKTAGNCAKKKNIAAAEMKRRY